ncbi:hypothetical protein AB0E75_31335 [Streptomyces griseoviridis]|uniref:Uncharacterized protein n=1 Tax=Streptomyces griseoviridis TaxID=45398 RepID=A0A918LKP8_STRGD|nr:hypothetical protein [Streptomyces niveoruber]GGS61861.1 hypothetical protein GCM10010238_58560 [Streptomyces niveoruber]
MTPLETLLAQDGDPPTLADLGGEDTFWQQADTLAASPLWFRAAETLLAEWDNLHHPDKAAAFITRALTTTTSPAAADDLLDQLVEHPGYLQRASSQLNNLALERSRHHTTPLEAELAGLFLEAALRLALPGTTRRYGLFDRLVDPGATRAPAAYARRVVRALGTAYEHWRDSDLLAALQHFTQTAVHGDAAYELAMCHLADAANAPDRPTLLAAFTTARSFLQQAIDADEDRPDATAYLAALDAVLAFDVGDTTTLTTATCQLRRSLTEHAMWLTGTRTHWRAGRYDTEAAWYTLSLDLEHADAHLDQRLTTWPNQTIQHILATYTAHRSVRLQPADAAPGLQVLVAPRIEDAFANRQGLLLHLRGLVADAPDDWDANAAHQLLQAIDDRLQADAPQAQSEGPGKAAAAASYPELAAELGSQLLASLPAHMLTSLQAGLADWEATLISRLPIAQQHIYNDIIAVLKGCDDFQHPTVRQRFAHLIVQTIRFLHSRTNRARAHHTPRFAYLFAPKPGEKLPLEETVQEDLHDYLYGNLEDVDIEVTDRSGGRADIEVRFPGFSTVIECKRTKGKTTRKGLRRYLGQTVAYQAGGITLGMLVVLDLTPKPSWIPNIRDDMWAEHIPSPVPEQRDRWAVVVRVPGNRTSPYDMDTPTMP